MCMIYQDQCHWLRAPQGRVGAHCPVASLPTETFATQCPPQRQIANRPSRADPPDTAPLPPCRVLRYLCSMEDAIKNLNQDIHLDAGANKIAARSAGGGDRTRCGPLGLGVISTLRKVFWIYSCNVPRQLQIDCQNNLAAARVGQETTSPGLPGEGGG